jgi:hypothetical protein
LLVTVLASVTESGRTTVAKDCTRNQDGAREAGAGTAATNPTATISASTELVSCVRVIVSFSSLSDLQHGFVTYRGEAHRLESRRK